jgi:NAD-dependent deacetylase
MRDARPNAVHRAIADLHRAGRLLAVVTQNIDGLHQMAGLPGDRVIELHGTNRWVECLTCARRFDPQPLFDEFSRTVRPPRCPNCNGRQTGTMLRPDAQFETLKLRSGRPWNATR